MPKKSTTQEKSFPQQYKEIVEQLREEFICPSIAFKTIFNDNGRISFSMFQQSMADFLAIDDNHFIYRIFADVDQNQKLLIDCQDWLEAMKRQGWSSQESNVPRFNISQRKPSHYLANQSSDGQNIVQSARVFNYTLSKREKMEDNDGIVNNSMKNSPYEQDLKSQVSRQIVGLGSSNDWMQGEIDPHEELPKTTDHLNPSFSLRLRDSQTNYENNIFSKQLRRGINEQGLIHESQPNAAHRNLDKEQLHYQDQSDHSKPVLQEWSEQQIYDSENFYMKAQAHPYTNPYFAQKKHKSGVAGNSFVQQTDTSLVLDALRDQAADHSSTIPNIETFVSNKAIPRRLNQDMIDENDLSDPIGSQNQRPYKANGEQQSFQDEIANHRSQPDVSYSKLINSPLSELLSKTIPKDHCIRPGKLESTLSERNNQRTVRQLRKPTYIYELSDEITKLSAECEDEPPQTLAQKMIQHNSNRNGQSHVTPERSLKATNKILTASSSFIPKIDLSVLHVNKNNGCALIQQKYKTLSKTERAIPQQCLVSPQRQNVQKSPQSNTARQDLSFGRSGQPSQMIASINEKVTKSVMPSSGVSTNRKSTANLSSRVSPTMKPWAIISHIKDRASQVPSISFSGLNRITQTTPTKPNIKTHLETDNKPDNKATYSQQKRQNVATLQLPRPQAPVELLAQIDKMRVRPAFTPRALINKDTLQDLPYDLTDKKQYATMGQQKLDTFQRSETAFLRRDNIRDKFCRIIADFNENLPQSSKATRKNIKTLEQVNLDTWSTTGNTEKDTEGKDNTSNEYEPDVSPFDPNEPFNVLTKIDNNQLSQTSRQMPSDHMQQQHSGCSLASQHRPMKTFRMLLDSSETNLNNRNTSNRSNEQHRIKMARSYV